MVVAVAVVPAAAVAAGAANCRSSFERQLVVGNTSRNSLSAICWLKSRRSRAGWTKGPAATNDVSGVVSPQVLRSVNQWQAIDGDVSFNGLITCSRNIAAIIVFPVAGHINDAPRGLQRNSQHMRRTCKTPFNRIRHAVQCTAR